MDMHAKFLWYSRPPVTELSDGNHGAPSPMCSGARMAGGKSHFVEVMVCSKALRCLYRKRAYLVTGKPNATSTKEMLNFW